MSEPIDLDLTQGSMPTLFRKLAVPAAIGMVFSTLYNVVDIFFAGLISTDAQAGMAIGFLAFFLNMAIGFGLGAAMGALVGNAKGRKATGEARNLAVQGISFGVIATGGLMILSWICGPWLIALVSEPGGYRDAAVSYFNWLIFALPGFLLAYGGNGILQARGDTVSMQRALVVSFFANCVLNPLLIYGLPGMWGGMGFNGIALSTVLCQTGVMVYVMTRIFGRAIMQNVQLTEFLPNLSCYRIIVVQMLPTSFAMLVMFGSGFIVQYYLRAFGGHAVAGYGVALRIEQLLLLPVLGMTGALLPIAAQNFGAGAHERVRSAMYFCCKLGLILTLCACPLLWFGSPYAMSLFTSDPEVIAVGVSYLRVDGFILPFYMMLFSTNSVLQALQKPIWTLWISVYRQGLAIFAFVWLFVGLWGFDIWGVWFGIAASVISGWIIAMIVLQVIAREKIGGMWVTSPAMG